MLFIEFIKCFSYWKGILHDVLRKGLKWNSQISLYKASVLGLNWCYLTRWHSSAHFEFVLKILFFHHFFCANPDLVIFGLLTLCVQNALHLWQMFCIFYCYVMLVTEWNFTEADRLISICASFTINAALMPFYHRELKLFQPHLHHREHGRESGDLKWSV